jgi:hypothetical protein
MTSVMVFIRPGTPGQLSAGAMVTFFFLLIGLFWKPFCSSNLNNLSSGTLIAEYCTLFVGIMIVLLDAMPAGGGGDDSLDRSIMSFVVVAVHGVALGWPFVHKVLSGKLAYYYEMNMDVHHWCCSKYARWCGSKEQRAQIATADAKIKKMKQKEKQRAQEAAAAKIARVNSSAQTQATSRSDLVFCDNDKREQTSVAGENATLGIVREHQIPEITAPAEFVEKIESGQVFSIHERQQTSILGIRPRVHAIAVPQRPALSRLASPSRDAVTLLPITPSSPYEMIVTPAELAPDDRFQPVFHLAGPARPANLSDDTPYYGVRREESTVVSPDFASSLGPQVRRM